MSGETTAVLSAFEYARQIHVQRVIIESAGLFWLLAELMILFWVLAGRKHLESHAESPRFAWSPALTRRALGWSFGFAGLALLTYGRHLVWPPAHHLLQGGAVSGIPEAALLARFTCRAHEHLALWSLFVTGWIALEIAIVYHGWRGYQCLRALLSREALL